MMLNNDLIKNLEMIIKELGWSVFNDQQNFPFVVYTHPEHPEQLRMPRNNSLDFFGADELIENIIQTVSNILEIDKKEFEFKLQNPKTTTLEFRYDSPSSREGTIPPDIMEGLAKQIPRLISDTYLNMLNKLPFRKTFPTTNVDVKEMIKNINYGQTKMGSYIITLHVDPIIRENQVGSLLDGDESIKLEKENVSRDAMFNLIKSVDKVSEIVMGVEDEEIISEKLTEIVESEDEITSVNLIEALSEIKLEDDGILELIGHEPLIHKEKVILPKRSISKKIKKEINEKTKKYVSEYKKVTKENVVYIGKFTGFKTSDADVAKRTGIAVYFEGENLDNFGVKKETLTCEMTYDQELQNRINSYIAKGTVVRIKATKEGKKLVEVTKLEPL